MSSWQRMATWFLKSVHRISKRPREIIVVVMASASQLQKYKNPISLEEGGETHPRKK